jgi:hypothetical protein
MEGRECGTGGGNGERASQPPPPPSPGIAVCEGGFVRWVSELGPDLGKIEPSLVSSCGPNSVHSLCENFIH